MVAGVVSRVVDGDTIDVTTDGGSLTVRLVTTNSPEQGECLADRALDHLVDTLEGVGVTLEIVGTDQFGRTLAHVFEGSRHLNLEMVELGLSLASTPDTGDSHGSAILKAERQAYETGTGLWAATACGRSGPLPRIVIDIGESSPDPPGTDEEHLVLEAIVIVNEDAVAADLSGWILRDESSRHRFTFPDGIVLGPGERMTINSADSGWFPGDGAVWNNDGDLVVLQDPTGTVAARWRY
jgi:hypothetical protein